MKKIPVFAACLLLAFLLSAPANALVDGSYTAQAHGFSETLPITLSLTLEGGVITAASATGEGEHLGYAEEALRELPEMMVKQNTVEVDGITGATWTCGGILEAAQSAMDAARRRAKVSGVYQGEAPGFSPDNLVKVILTLEEGRITRVEAAAEGDEPDIVRPALQELSARAVAFNTEHVDAVAGATLTSRGFTRALRMALDQSSGALPPAVLAGVSGTFHGEAEGFSNASPVRVTLTLEEGRFTQLLVSGEHETAKYAQPAFEALRERALGKNSAEIDAYAGATWTSRGFINALKQALASAEDAGLARVSGTFTGEAEGFSNASMIQVTVSMEQGRFTQVSAVGEHETADYARPALDALCERALSANSAEIDAYTGATWTSRGFIAALRQALHSAALAGQEQAAAGQDGVTH